MAERKPIVYVSGNPQEIADTDRVKNTGITRSGTAPSSPQDKDAWLDTSTGQLKVYQSGAWHSPTYLQSVNTDLVYDTTPQLGGNLDVNGRTITSASNGNIDLDPNGSGGVVIKGNSTRGAGAIQLNCEFNSHGIKLKSPPHSANASYTLTFPNNAGTNGYALTTNGSGVLSWTEQVPNGSITSAKLANDITIAGNLTVNGTTTTVNSTTLSVDDRNIELGSVSSPSDTTADGGGITLKGASDKTITWVNSTNCWTFNQSVNLTAGTASAPALILNGDVNTGFFQSATDEIAVGTAGSERLRVGSAGQIGIAGANYGTTGQVLMSGGASAAPTWGDVSSSPTFEATASGTLANGDTVVVNADGTVSAVAESAVTAAAGTPVTFEAGNNQYVASCYGNGAVLVCYQDVSNNYYGTAVFGTVSGNTITFGTPVVFRTSYADYIVVTYDSVNDKFVVSYRDVNSGSRGFSTVIYRTSTNTVNVGGLVQFCTQNVRYLSQAYCADEGCHAVAFKNETYTKGEVVLLETSSSNNNVSAGTQRTFASYSVMDIDIAIQGKTVIIIWSKNDGNYWTESRVGQVDRSASNGMYWAGTIQQMSSFSTYNPKIDFVGPNKIVIVWRDVGGTPTANRGGALLGTVTNTLDANDGTISSNAYVNFTTNGSINVLGLVYNSAADKIIITYGDSNDSGKGKFVTGTISSTSLTFTSPTEFEAGQINNVWRPVYDSNAEKVVVSYLDQDDYYGKSAVLTTPYTATNLKTTNYIGISDGAYANGATATVQVVGSVDDAQSSLTPGTEYYVQRDGSLATTAASPSVKAGLAVASDKLLIRH